MLGTDSARAYWLQATGFAAGRTVMIGIDAWTGSYIHSATTKKLKLCECGCPTWMQDPPAQPDLQDHSHPHGTQDPQDPKGPDDAPHIQDSYAHHSASAMSTIWDGQT